MREDMFRRTAVVLAPVILVLASPVTSGAATATPGAMPTQQMPRAVTLDLHSAYQQALQRQSTVAQPATSCGLFPSDPVCHPQSAGPSSPAPAAAIPCTSSNCGPLTYHGGPVQRTPRVFLLLWGPKWSTETTYSGFLERMMAGWGVQNAANPDTWSTTLAQYTDAGGSPSFFNGVDGRCAGCVQAYVDTSTPPTNTTQAQLAAEAAALAPKLVTAHTQSAYDQIQIAVATQSGTCPDGFPGDLVGCAGGGACGWHVWGGVSDGGASFQVPYINLPYMPDSSICASYGEPNAYEATWGHEYAETITDPLLNAWFNNPGGEVGDECPGWQPVTLPTESVTQQSLYSNAAGGCTYSSGQQGPVTGIGGRCVDDNLSGVGNGNRIDIFSCNQTAAQRLIWYQIPGSSYGTLRVFGRCLDVTGGSTANGAKLQLWTCNGLSQQNWRHTSGGQWIVQNSGKCLDDPGATLTNGTQLQIWACNGLSQQNWSTT
jgi:Ricin-type beta-trefoil lectin domain